MSRFQLLEDEKFKEALDMVHKGYIDKCFSGAGIEKPIPKSLIPLSYDNPKIEKGLNQLRQGAKNALFMLDKFEKDNYTSQTS